MTALTGARLEQLREFQRTAAPTVPSRMLSDLALVEDALADAIDALGRACAAREAKV